MRAQIYNSTKVSPNSLYRYMKYKAFLFDLNGTMIDDMPYHIHAWHGILNELDVKVTFDRLKQECYGKNDELLERIFPEKFSIDEKKKLIIAKDKQYQSALKPNLKLIPGLYDFLKAAHIAGIKVAIGSAAAMFNINFVLDGLDIRKYIDAIVSADDVGQSKPDPETWLECIKRLNVDPKDCLVFEDTPKGAESARNAGLSCMIITTLHTAEEFEEYDNIIGFMADFQDKKSFLR